MTTSIDANILALAWTQNPAWIERARAALRQAFDQGPVCICAPVFSELLGLPGRTAQQLEKLLISSGIGVEWDLDEAIWKHAGMAYQGYVRRRKKSGGGIPRRLLTDFLIGAHASARDYQLLTLDLNTYRAAFPELTIVRP